MKVLFLTLMRIGSLSDEGIYMDLMREFVRKGHEVVILSPLEKKRKRKTEMLREGGLTLLRVKTGNLFEVGMVEKGLSQLFLPFHYKRAIRKFVPDADFQLILYSTPPISLAGLVKSLKKKTKATTYLMLKDIFPQNAVDIGLLSPFAAKLLFRRKEKLLYRVSDFIGCMSPANVTYLMRHNELNTVRVGNCPNAITPKPMSAIRGNRRALSEKYGFPSDKILFLYGGNLGKPQDIPFVIRCLTALKEDREVHFVICGDGTEYPVLERYIKEAHPPHVTLLRGLPKKDYDVLVGSSDVGLIFLDYRFTIPNFPSRLLSYLEASLPVLVVADRSTDMGRIVEENFFGFYAPSNSEEAFCRLVEKLKDPAIRNAYGERARTYLEKNYTTEICYQSIIKNLFRTV